MRAILNQGKVYIDLYLGRFPDSKIYGANMRSIWGRQDPDGLHMSPMNFAIWVVLVSHSYQEHMTWLCIPGHVKSRPNYKPAHEWVLNGYVLEIVITDISMKRVLGIFKVKKNLCLQQDTTFWETAR